MKRMLPYLTWMLLWSPVQGGSQGGLDVEELLFLDVSEVVGATGFEQQVSGAPASVTIITAAEIRALGVETLEEALAILAGVYTFDLRHRHNLNARGYPETGENNNHLLILLDGHRLNDYIYGRAVIGDEIPVSMELVERVELIHGPGSSVYGANAFSGVVNIITVRGRDQQGNTASAETAGHHKQGLNLSMGRRVGAFEWLFAASGSQSRGSDAIYYPDFDTAVDDGRSIDTDARNSLKFYLKMRYRDWTLVSGWNDHQSEISSIPNLAVFNRPENEYQERSHFVDLRHNRMFKNGDSLDFRIYQDTYKEKLTYALPIPGLGVFPNLTTSRNRDTGLDLRYRRAISGRGSFVVGGEYVKIHNQNLRNEFVDIVVLHESENQNEIVSLYAQGEWEAGPWLFNLGLRHDHFSTFGESTNPRLAAIYRFDQGRVIKLLYGTAFRAPNALENYFETSVGLAPNPDLEPETIRTTELVWEHLFNPRLQSRVSVFHNTSEDIINLAFQPESQFFIHLNQPGLSVAGAEAEFRWRPNPRQSWRLNYSYHRLELDNPTLLIKHPPKNMANLVMVLNTPNDHFTLGGHLAWRSAYDKPEPSQKTADLLLNANLTWRPGEQVYLSLGGENLLDDTYYEPAPGAFVARYIPAEGRTWRLKLTTHF